MGHAIFEQRSGILGVAVVAPCGVISSDQLVKLGDLSRKLPVHGMKLTTRQTLVFLINREDLDQFSSEIEQAGLRIGVFGNIVRNVKGCSGSDSLCKRSQGNAFALGGRIQERFMNQPTPKDFKISTAGCVRGCTDPYCADFGAVAVGVDRFDVYVGGRGGSKVPRHGQCIVEGISAEKVLVALEYVLNKYRELGNPDERLCRVIDRCGTAEFVPPPEVLGNDSEPAVDDFSAFLDGK
jgi:dissimilatory sulfite reductase (desulfoviridin) alpha/beta subunit